MIAESSRAVFGDALASHPWSHFLTLTGRGRSPSRPRLLSGFRRFERTVGGILTCAFTWFMVIEDGSMGRSHAHALLALPPSVISIEHLSSCWTLGRADVRVYDPNRGAAYYVAKFINDPMADLYTSRGFRLRPTDQ